MKGKDIKKTLTCEWIKVEPVQGTQCLAETEDQLCNVKRIEEILEFRANFHLQRTGMELAGKMMEEK